MLLIIATLLPLSTKLVIKFKSSNLRNISICIVSMHRPSNNYSTAQNDGGLHGTFFRGRDCNVLRKGICLP